MRSPSLRHPIEEAYGRALAVFQAKRQVKRAAYRAQLIAAGLLRPKSDDRTEAERAAEMAALAR